MTPTASGQSDVANGTPFRNLLVFPDRLRYLAWTLMGRHTNFQCRLSSGPVLCIRPAPSDDWENAYEIFRLKVYEIPVALKNVRCIVDVGASVGYSLLFWRSVYPQAQILAFEPHPNHCALIRWHLQKSGYSDHVELIEAGAARRPGTSILVDDGFRSRLIGERDSQNINRPFLKIRTVDFFETIGPDPIDILKIDIEGSEYELLQDPRFEQVARRSKCIAIEWHKRAPHHLGEEWCNLTYAQKWALSEAVC